MLFALSHLGCISQRKKNNSLTIGNLKGNVSKIKTSNLKEGTFEVNKYDREGNLIFVGNGLLTYPDSIKNYEIIRSNDSIVYFEFYEDGVLWNKKEQHFLVEQKMILEFNVTPEKVDTVFSYRTDKAGNIIMLGKFGASNVYESYREYNRFGLLKTIGYFEPSLIVDADSRKTKRNIFITYKYNTRGCLVEEKIIYKDRDTYKTTVFNDEYCNSLILIEKNINTNKIEKQFHYKNDLDINKNWINKITIDSNGDTLNIKAREIEYYK